MNFQSILGVNKESEVFHQLESFLDDNPIKRENNITINNQKTHDYELLFKQKGVLITFLNDEVIKIKVYFSPSPICQPFRSEFVFGLSYISSENDIKKQFDFPQNLNQEPMRADNLYQYKNCTVAFDAMTAEINFAEIRKEEE